MEVFTGVMSRHILSGKCCPYSPKRTVSSKREEEEGEEEWDSSHLSVRPGIQPAIASYQLLLGVLGPSVEGGDDMTERVALRGAIISRVDFLTD